ncbi:MAG: hypothetical protein RL736_628 [Pseudomonadota bacterium]|jgi:hypothetical protein
MAKYQKVTLELNYVVRDDDQSMQEQAKQCLYEDIMNLVKYNELYDAITLEDAPNAKEEDIPEFLLEKIA